MFHYDQCSKEGSPSPFCDFYDTLIELKVANEDKSWFKEWQDMTRKTERSFNDDGKIEIVHQHRTFFQFMIWLMKTKIKKEFTNISNFLQYFTDYFAQESLEEEFYASDDFHRWKEGADGMEEDNFARKKRQLPMPSPAMIESFKSRNLSEVIDIASRFRQIISKTVELYGNIPEDAEFQEDRLKDCPLLETQGILLSEQKDGKYFSLRKLKENFKAI